VGTKLTRNLNRSATAKLAENEYARLCGRADAQGVTLSEYVRRLILSDLQYGGESDLLHTVEAEHTRLTLLAAQQGRPLNAATLRDLRTQAILQAPALVEQALRLLRQQRNGWQVE
jgi:hypothetical protein